MGCTLGRITGLESPRTIRQEGDRLRLAGEFAPTSVAEGVALAQQVVGYPSPDEEVVPFTYDATAAGGVLDGFYFVVSTQVDWAKLAGGLFSWEAELVAVPGKQAPLFEVSTLGAARTTATVITPQPWFGAPSSDSGDNLSAPWLAGVIAGGELYATESDAYTDSITYQTSVDEFYYGASQIQTSSDSGTTWHTVTGRQMADVGTYWRIDNDAVRFGPINGGGFRAERKDVSTGVWESIDFEIGGYTAGFTNGLDWTDSRPTILLNSVTAVSVRFTTPEYGGYVDFTLRRGVPYVECYRTSMDDQHSVYRTASDAGTSITGGLEATSSTNGNNWVLMSPNVITKVTTGAAGIYLTSSGTSWSFAISPLNDTATGITVPQLYFAAMDHVQQVVAR